MNTVLKCINREEKQNVYPMFTPIGLKTTKPLDNQEVLNYFSDPAGIRTQDPYIKSVLLYQLSYGIVVCILDECKFKCLIYFCKCFNYYFLIIFCFFFNILFINMLLLCLFNANY